MAVKSTSRSIRSRWVNDVGIRSIGNRSQIETSREPNIRDALGWLCCVWMSEVRLLGPGGQSGSKTKLTMPIHSKTPRKLRVQAPCIHFF